MNRFIFSFLIISFNMAFASTVYSSIKTVGEGSYFTHFPGADAAGRNGYPSGTPQLSGKAALKPVPTNDWWSSLVKENHASNLFSYPFAMKTLSKGLIVSYIPKGVLDDLEPIVVGVKGLSAVKATVSDHSDWTVTMNWNDGQHSLSATAGIAMPFLYFTKETKDEIVITINSGTVKIENEILIIENAKYGKSFAVYAPSGSVWSNNSNVYTSTLNGKNYWSLAMLSTENDIRNNALELKKYAYVFPANTNVNWTYNEKTSVLRTDFIVTTDIKEGNNTQMLLGLLPHQWSNLSDDSNINKSYCYNSVRGEIKTIEGNKFSTENVFNGILSTLPYIDTNSAFSKDELNRMLTLMQNDQIGEWTDSYNDGQLLNRLIQSARIAYEINNRTAFDALFKTIKNRVENWLKAEPGEVAFLFYYNKDWSAMIGYPAGHGQDSNLNDHHFHWGYFIHAASFLEQYEPGWASKWGEMVNLLVRDAACSNRNDEMFPFLRNFSPYAGHCWANGFATFPQGNDQESTSESMQFHSSLIHWGTITNDKAIRDLGIYLYTTEMTAIDEYWFDMYNRNFPQDQSYSLISRLWGNSFDNGTFWTNDIAASYGIELYPIHGGSFYLSHNKEYVKKLWKEISQNTGILNNEVNPNLWHDVMWMYLAFIDPQQALNLYNSYKERDLKFGISDAQTYYWLHSMLMLGQTETSITSDYPISSVFNKNGRITYVAHNYGKTDVDVTFSDGYKMNVPAGKLISKSKGEILPDVNITYPANNTKLLFGESYIIKADAIDYEGDIKYGEFYRNNVLIDRVHTSPYQVNWTPEFGDYVLTAKAYTQDNRIGISSKINVTVSYDASCKIESKEASQGDFQLGYVARYETIGSDVSVSFELLDNRSDLIAYIWDYTNGFSEAPMQKTETNRFTYTFSNQTKGNNLSFACKFAFAGGMSVTKKIDYIVGELCASITSIEDCEELDFDIFPNPVNDDLNINLPQNNCNIIICNIYGVPLLNITASQKATIDMRKYVSGLYILKVESGNKVKSKTIIKR